MNTQIIFKNGVSFTIAKPELKDYFSLVDRSNEKNVFAQLEEVLKHITYPSSEEARSFLNKYPFSIKKTALAIAKMAGSEIEIKKGIDIHLTIPGVPEDSLGYEIDGKWYLFKRFSLSQYDLIMEVISSKGFFTCSRAYDLCLACALNHPQEEFGSAKRKLESLFETYPALPMVIFHEIWDDCSMPIEEERGKF